MSMALGLCGGGSRMFTSGGSRAQPAWTQGHFINLAFSCRRAADLSPEGVGLVEEPLPMEAGLGSRRLQEEEATFHCEGLGLWMWACLACSCPSPVLPWELRPSQGSGIKQGGLFSSRDSPLPLKFNV